MRIRILGSAAGGGLPQWNCRCPNCDAARRGDPHVRPRTQSSVAISADDRHWFLLNASADVRAQLQANSMLWPPAGAARGTTIAGCILTDAEIDHASGLLQLREGCRFRIFSTSVVRSWLTTSLTIEPILSAFADRPWTEFNDFAAIDLPLPDDAPSGLEVKPFPSGDEVPRFVRDAPESAPGSRIGLRIKDRATGGILVYAPGTSVVSLMLSAVSRDADCLLVDGTFWSDDEPQKMNISQLTASQMKHVPISGPQGSLAWLAERKARHRAYVHINNTNPVLNEQSEEYREVVAAGVRVANDGDEFLI